MASQAATKAMEAYLRRIEGRATSDENNYDAATAAKEALQLLLLHKHGYQPESIGLVSLDHGYGLFVGVSDSNELPLIPSSIDDVKIEVAVTGPTSTSG